MADQFIAYDPSADAGERLAPEVRAEIAVLAPSTVLNGAVTTAKLADDAVTAAKIAAGSVGNPELAGGAVATANIASGAVTADKLAGSSVTPAKCSTGVVTSTDVSSNSVATTIMYLTAAQYAAIVSPNPNTLYFIS